MAYVSFAFFFSKSQPSPQAFPHNFEQYFKDTAWSLKFNMNDTCMLSRKMMVPYQGHAWWSVGAQIMISSQYFGSPF